MALTIKEAIEATIRDCATYQIGTTAPHYIPNETEPKNMVYMVAYDITEPKRLRRVAKICEDYGVRVEKSVFECDLNDTIFARFWGELQNEIDGNEDALIAYRICKSCIKNILTAGVIARPTPRLLYIF